MVEYNGWHKLLGRSMLTIAGLFFAVGVFGLVDGIRSVIGGGYADNIALGLIIMLLFPIPCLIVYIFVRQEEKNEKNMR